MAKLHRSATKYNTRYSTEVERHLEAARSAIVDAVDVQVGRDASFTQRESAMLELSNEVGRRFVEQDLQRIADGHQATRLRIDDVLHTRHSIGNVTYHSLCGPVAIRRWVYRRRLRRNDVTAVPLELAAGLVERATPALAYRVALGYAQGPSRHCIQQLTASARQPPSRSTVERMAKRIGTHATQQSPRIEPLVRRFEGLPVGTRAISLGLDRTTVPMQEPVPQGATKRWARKRTKPYVRSKPAPVEVNYRMAYVGTVSFVDRDRRSLRTLRYVASASAGPSKVLESMVADVVHANTVRAKSRQSPLPLGIVQDGAAEMWTLVKDALGKAGLADDCRETLDWYHLFEHLADMLSMLPILKVTREATLRRWKKQLREDDAACRRILAYATRKVGSYARDCQTARKRPSLEHAKLLRAHVVYLRNNQHRMRYANTLAASLPLGSGATEGACRSTISARAKRSGQRWKSLGLDAALTLRAHHVSERLPDIWNALSPHYTRQVRCAA